MRRAVQHQIQVSIPFTESRQEIEKTMHFLNTFRNGIVAFENRWTLRNHQRRVQTEKTRRQSRRSQATRVISRTHKSVSYSRLRKWKVMRLNATLLGEKADACQFDWSATLADDGTETHLCMLDVS
jgi:hypothetical protein